MSTIHVDVGYQACLLHLHVRMDPHVFLPNRARLCLGPRTLSHDLRHGAESPCPQNCLPRHHHPTWESKYPNVGIICIITWIPRVLRIDFTPVVRKFSICSGRGACHGGRGRTDTDHQGSEQESFASLASKLQ